MGSANTDYIANLFFLDFYTKPPNVDATYFYKKCFHTTFLLIKGGIKLKHEITNIKFLVGHDENKEVPLIKRVNSLVMETMKQCWRLKHHPLTQKEDLFQLLPGITTLHNNYILLNLKKTVCKKNKQKNKIYKFQCVLENDIN